ncbi:MAG: sulfurtransferase, partial [Acidimicrobiales bacterium]
MPGPIVTVHWLVAHAPAVVICDVRWYLDGRPGAAAYEAAHLPSAVFLDLDRWLAGPASPDAGRHPLPDPEVFAEGMRRAGVGDGAAVVAYDDAGGMVASRLVWMLRALGEDAALLDGGLAAWTGPLEHGGEADRPVEAAPARFTARPWPP